MLKKIRFIDILKTSWAILKRNKKLLFFSLVPTVILGFLPLGFLIFLLHYFYIQEKIPTNPLVYILFFVFFIISLFLYFFFKIALIYSVNNLLRNEKVNLQESLKIARKYFKKIIRWEFFDVSFRLGVSAPYRKEMGPAEALPIFTIISSWHFLTIFVPFILIIEDFSIKEAIIKSSQLFKKTIKDTAILEYSFGPIFAIIGIGGVFLIPILLMLFESPFIIQHAIAVAIISYGLLIVGIMIAGMIVATLREIFMIILYRYAISGEMPAVFSKKENIQKEKEMEKW